MNLIKNRLLLCVYYSTLHNIEKDKHMGSKERDSRMEKVRKRKQQNTQTDELDDKQMKRELAK